MRHASPARRALLAAGDVLAAVVAFGHHVPELYLLASYFELREFDKVETLLQQLGEKSPDDQEVKVLASLYKRAIGNAKMAEKK